VEAIARLKIETFAVFVCCSKKKQKIFIYIPAFSTPKIEQKRIFPPKPHDFGSFPFVLKYQAKKSHEMNAQIFCLRSRVSKYVHSYCGDYCFLLPSLFLVIVLWPHQCERLCVLQRNSWIVRNSDRFLANSIGRKKAIIHFFFWLWLSSKQTYWVHGMTFNLIMLFKIFFQINSLFTQ